MQQRYAYLSFLITWFLCSHCCINIQHSHYFKWWCNSPASNYLLKWIDLEHIKWIAVNLHSVWTQAVQSYSLLICNIFIVWTCLQSVVIIIPSNYLVIRLLAFVWIQCVQPSIQVFIIVCNNLNCLLYLITTLNSYQRSHHQ